ncbi:hypothetical protein IPF86_03425 [Candidatus Nomurabacteria bacterium]|nr:MAG: hypothetical protein IPF86_03425 [Candidatus Nomurabacteria bacterium]
MEVVIHSPLQAEAELPDLSLPRQVLPGKTPPYFSPKTHPVVSNTKINDEETIKANLIFIDFKKESFRRFRKEPNPTDPSKEQVEEILLLYISSIRTILQGGQIKFKPIDSIPWMIEYLNDDYSELPIDEALIRGAFNFKSEFNISPIDGPLWEQIKLLVMTKEKPHIWETLYLNALSVLPDSGAAITLTFASLENLINHALESLVVKSSITPEVWDWIKIPSNEKRNWFKEPSVIEQYTSILHMVSGKNIQEDKELSELLLEIKNVRNNFIHEGLLLNSKKKELSDTEVENLVRSASKIIEWVESYLPEEKRRRKNTTKINFEDSIIYDTTQLNDRSN